MEQATQGQAQVVDADVAIMGAGIVGLFNALQYAKRGFRVLLLDNARGQKRSFKVGESFLIFTNPFLRTVGGLDAFAGECFPKHGVWFTYGLEHSERFEATSEWGVHADPPHYLYEQAQDKRYFRASLMDVQIVRPEAEDVMRESLASFPNVRFLDTVKVRDVVIQEEEGRPHELRWECQATREQGTVRARWVLDCSGRNRLLARKQKHAVELKDGFQTTAVWGQFEGITDDLFGEPWVHTYADGDQTSRDLHTLHLWGEGYWIWVIRLSKQRISVGATFDQRKPPPGATPEAQLWELIGRHPPLRKALAQERMLEFRMYRDVQYMTDTFVSAKRYGMMGDAASIVDAYYSQGISLALVSSWHVANLVEQDLRGGGMDPEYLERVNRATRQDWHIMRNMIREKYTPAIADSRFFVLSHMLDLSIFWSAGASRSRISRWLVETGGDTRRETPELRELREYLSRHMFYSQTKPWHWLSPERVRELQGRLQAGIGERARWRLEHGIRVPTLKAIVRLAAPVPQLWKLPFLRGQERADLSAEDFIHPEKFLERVPAWLRRWLPESSSERLSRAIAVRGQTLLVLFLLGYAYDWADTEVQKLLLQLGLLEPDSRAEPQETEAPSPVRKVAS
ncbi:hypothetical protein D187_007411 [Cystobacter fuscus DSM 2262]|uniref:FAD-binding domain-containing protein n=1 Tax=Cystobacter fuscus (strain ATCC 25194 / DSM 2262 / NBRC 100088 / M29) TaxID=1242864 RepID=S9Q443_CYSF2|nr:FAD-dependent monooxygenase [Cystobacter fuscus]EPX56069.1 hypothetical protein D187_007411 [Cystobacter fuscus DSM 2262]